MKLKKCIFFSNLWLLSLWAFPQSYCLLIINGSLQWTQRQSCWAKQPPRRTEDNCRGEGKGPTRQRHCKLSLYFGLCHIRNVLWKSRRGGENNLPNFDQNKTVLTVLEWLGLSCLGAHMPFKSHWFTVWKVETVWIGLHNRFEVLVYSMALLDFLFVFAASIYRQLHFLLPSFKYTAAATPSTQNILAIVCMCIFIKLIWASWLLHFQLLWTHLSSPAVPSSLFRNHCHCAETWSPAELEQKLRHLHKCRHIGVLFWKPFQVLDWNSLV